MAERSRTATILATGVPHRLLATLEAQRLLTPNDPSVLERLGRLYRQTGALDQAAATYTTLAGLRPDDDEVVYLARMLEGHGAVRRSTTWPPEFLRQRNWLDADRQTELADCVRGAATELVPAVVLSQGQHAVRPTTKRAMSVPLADRLPWFHPLVVAQASGWCAALGVAAQPLRVAGIKITRYARGDFFELHRDRGPGAERRLLGFICYLRFPGYDFTGGQLIIYDTDPATGAPVSSWTAVPPEPYSLVVLPSAHWHEVTPVECADEAPLAGRFTISGWIHAA